MTSEMMTMEAITDDALQEIPAAPFVESYFPEAMSGCAESALEHRGSPGRLARGNPWVSLATALGAGAALAMIYQELTGLSRRGEAMKADL